MKLLFKITLMALSMITPNISLADTKIEPQLEVVSELNIDKYLGKWYEIARIPNSFERNCVGVTAEYSMKSENTINVVNTCYKETLDGKKKSAKGVAKIVGTGKLKVSFVPIPILSNLTSGDYWVIYVDKDYSLAIVGEPKRKYGWILSRTPSINEQKKNKAIGILEKNGYTYSKFETVLQNIN